MILNILAAIVAITLAGIVTLIVLISALVLVAAYASIVHDMRGKKPIRPRGITAWRKRSIMEKYNK